MVVLLSLVAATAFALGTVLQQKGTVQTSGQDAGGVRFLASLLHRPVWLLGGAVTVVGGLCQTLALRDGTLAGVQAITTLSLVIALPFGAWLTDQRITGTVWLGAAALVVGIVLFLSVGAPESAFGISLAKNSGNRSRSRPSQTSGWIRSRRISKPLTRSRM